MRTGKAQYSVLKECKTARCPCFASNHDCRNCDSFGRLCSSFSPNARRFFVVERFTRESVGNLNLNLVRDSTDSIFCESAPKMNRQNQTASNPKAQQKKRGDQ
jgi:hypothetical protein